MVTSFHTLCLRRPHSSTACERHVCSSVTSADTGIGGRRAISPTVSHRGFPPISTEKNFVCGCVAADSPPPLRIELRHGSLGFEAMITSVRDRAPSPPVLLSFHLRSLVGTGFADGSDRSDCSSRFPDRSDRCSDRSVRLRLTVQVATDAGNVRDSFTEDIDGIPAQGTAGARAGPVSCVSTVTSSAVPCQCQPICWRPHRDEPRG